MKAIRTHLTEEEYKEDRRLYLKQHYEKNKEMYSEKGKIYRENNKDTVTISKKKYYDENKEKISSQSKKHYEDNKEKIKARVKRYRENNKEKVAAMKKVYRDNNKEKAAQYQKEYGVKYRKTDKRKMTVINYRHKRRAIKNKGDVSTNQLLELRKSAKFCYWCETSLKNKKVHIDHYIPLSKGGEHTLSNLVIACSRCNLTKHAKDPLEFANSIGKLL